MKSLQANMNALTNEVKQLKILQLFNFERKTGDKSVRCYGCNKDCHIKLNCLNVKK